MSTLQRVERTALVGIAIACAVVCVLAALVLVTWRVPLALVTVAGGLALATVLSFPVRLLSRLMPRRSRGAAVALTFLTIAVLIVLAALFVVPRLAQQFETLTEVLSSSLTGAERYLLTGFEFLDDRGLLPGTAEQAVSRIEEDLSNGAGALAGGVVLSRRAIERGRAAARGQEEAARAQAAARQDEYAEFLQVAERDGEKLAQREKEPKAPAA